MNNPTLNKNNSSAHTKLLSALLALGVFFDLIALSCENSYTGDSVWKSASMWITKTDYSAAICLAFIVLFFVNAGVAVYGVYSAIIKHNTPLYACGIGLSLRIIMLTLNSSFEILEGLGTMILLLDVITAAAGLVYSIVCVIVNSNKNNRTVSKGKDNRKKHAMTALSAASLLVTLSLFYIPFCSYTSNRDTISLIPLSALSQEKNSLTGLIIFGALFALCTVSFISFLSSFTQYSSSQTQFADKIRSAININTIITGGYFVAGVAYCCLRNSSGGMFTTESYIPFLISAGISIVFAFVIRGINFPHETMNNKTARFARIELFIYGLMVSAITAISALSDIIKVKVTIPEPTETLRLNGYKILKSYKVVDEGFQLVAFLLLAILTVIIALFMASLISYISKSKLFYKVTVAQIVSGSIFSLLIGLFGKYYEIVQKMNRDSLLSWIEKMTGLNGISGILGYDVEYKVTSQSYYWFLAVMVVAVIALIRKPYTRAMMHDPSVSGFVSVRAGGAGGYTSDESTDIHQIDPSKIQIDPCPAFTELDRKALAFREEADQAVEFSFENPTLPRLVQFVVNYARDSRLHLSYTHEDIAAFIAGLGTTKLTILQGMSGTGKTSLPKIFTEAIMGNCDIIEVESSWRDKHELLGYYNEFSKTYTPKKFTQALYKAKLNPDKITFIVLDEMNLSRIEYYFSDFLSLMENEEDKREIKLVNLGLFRTESGTKQSYFGLTDGHTLKIPKNVWFIGTANRDESTFEISDKVYDRAHTMNFNKRAPKVFYRNEPLPQRYLSIDNLMQLIEEATKTVKFDINSNAIIKEVEDILAPYNISFGNRVANQIETFVSIYCSCFAPSADIMHTAIETILLSKVVSKLEFKSIDNKAQLASEFNRLKLFRCSEFIMKLNED